MASNLYHFAMSSRRSVPCSVKLISELTLLLHCTIYLMHNVIEFPKALTPEVSIINLLRAKAKISVRCTESSLFSAAGLGFGLWLGFDVP